MVMTHDQFEAHILRIGVDPIYGVGFRAGLAGSSRRPPYETVNERSLWEEGWQNGTAEAAKAGQSLTEWMASDRKRVRG